MKLYEALIGIPMIVGGAWLNWWGFLLFYDIRRRRRYCGRILFVFSCIVMLIGWFIFLPVLVGAP